MSFIQAVSTALPQHRVDKEQVLEVARRALKGKVPFLDEALGLFLRAGVGTRYLVEPLDRIVSDWRFVERNRAFLDHSISIGKELITDLLQKAELDVGQIDLLITTSCTGFAIPAVDAHLINYFHMRNDIKRLPITELGCAAGAIALARAHDYLKAFPAHRVMILAMEFPSLTLRPEDLRPANLVSAALFGDGAAGTILGKTEGPCRITASKSVFFYDSLEQMGFDLDERGFRIILDKGVPDLIERELPPALDEFLREQNLERGLLSTFVLHPGGRKILDTVEQVLGVTAEHLAVSRAVLREVGNLSSASVLYVLAETLRLGRGVGLGLLGAFGPGFNAELLLADFGNANTSQWSFRFGPPTVSIS